MRFTRSTGSPYTFDSSSYLSAIRAISSGSSAEFTATTYIKLVENLGNAAEEQAYGEVVVWEPSAATYTYAHADFTSRSGGSTSHRTVGGGHLAQADDVTGVRFLFIGGNITSGRLIVQKWKP